MPLNFLLCLKKYGYLTFLLINVIIIHRLLIDINILERKVEKMEDIIKKVNEFSKLAREKGVDGGREERA